MGHGRSQVTAQPSQVLNTGTVSIPRFREKDQSTAAQILEAPKEKSGEQRSLCYGLE